MMNVKTFKFINLDYMDMMSDGDADMKKTMLEMLFEEVPEEMNKMKECHESKKWEELGDISHKMKSTLAFVGNTAMTDANSAIEKNLKHEELNTELVNENMKILMELYPLALEAVSYTHLTLPTTPYV